LLTASGNGYYQDLRISANDYDFRYGPSAWNSAYSALQISSTGSVVFNEGGLDADTRFEGTSDSNVLAVNAGNNRVGVGTNGGLHKLSVLHTGTALGGVAHFSIGSAASAYATTVFRVDNVDNNFAIDQNYAGQDRNRLFIKRTNGYIGIGGNTDPQAMLDIKGDTTTYEGMAKIYLTDVSSNTARRNWAIGNGGSAYGNFTIGVSNVVDGDPMANGTHKTPFIIQPSGAVVINEDSNDADFRVESDSNSHMLFVDAGNDRVSIGESTNAPNATLEVVGGVTMTAGWDRTIEVAGDSSSGFPVIVWNSQNVGYGGIGYDRTASTAPMKFWVGATGSDIIATGINALELGKAGGITVFNQEGENVDFRIESDNSTSAFVVDGETGHVGVGGNPFTSHAMGVFDAQTSVYAQTSTTESFPAVGAILQVDNTSNVNYSASKLRMTCDTGNGTSVGWDITCVSGVAGGYNSDLTFGRRTGNTTWAEYGKFNSSGSFHVSRDQWDGTFDSTDTNVRGTIITGTGSISGQIDTDSYGSEIILINNVHSVGAECSILQYRTRTITEGSIHANGSGLAISNVSDYRKKQNIADLTGCLDTITNLRPVSYNLRPEYTTDTSEVHKGFIAHEVADHMPNLVTGAKDAVDDEGNVELQSVSYTHNEMIATLVGAIKELQAENDAMRLRLDALESA